MNLEDLHTIAQQQQEADSQLEHILYVCTGTACQSSRSEEVLKAIQAELKARGLEKKCAARPGGCQGLCARGPLANLDHGKQIYQHLTPEDAPAVVDSFEAEPPSRIKLDKQLPFFTRQVRVATQGGGLIDPTDLNSYIAAGGYTALLDSLMHRTPAEVLQEIVKSGLRGRGGGGYSTGLKWSTVAKAVQTPKYVIVNGDEGDPGAFMDRAVMEDYPFRVLEGMTLAAYAVGASHGYIYVRAEYPLAVKRLQNAIKQAQKQNLLGSNIAGTPFSLNVEIRLGAGAFVCGEETALIASIEGGRGVPRPRPPYPAESGLWGKPTLINNVETIANVVQIVQRGGDWFASIGTEKSKGTKVFALSGRINNTGLIEVPMGITLREIIFEIGGGIPEGKKFKAVQTGGPSGGCIPEQYLDMHVDYESLTQVGSIMGSGGMIVMDETSCMVDVAKYFMEFSMAESCGKCVPCRVGTAQMYDLLCKISEGRATLDDLALLESLCDMVKHTSLCGLGQSAPNPVISTLRFFRDEYLAHILERRCPAGVCQMKPEVMEVHS
ncbi:MAG: NADH-quinone oxidoreductase subunit L [Candidatus Thermofonsia Clade 1 bacterium]|uniref:NADH-quinone oxidoreductase subunit L n=1 Tax=Candidatus Thermofonsia Clade 1 bacterium TaxID=2364210 RepID=A0A2M8NYI5_9CHLR|nr:MAG: NADH-quinone oxidoreductase subunit L [Candidatus Thermofonsia Clade 1 bacterium]